jgi:hypothetical protein
MAANGISTLATKAPAQLANLTIAQAGMFVDRGYS